MRKGYIITKQKYLGGLLPGILWTVLTPSGAKYIIKRYDNGSRDYSYMLEYAEDIVASPSLIVGIDDGLKTKEDAIKMIYTCEDHGKFESITEMTQFTERIIRG